MKAQLWASLKFKIWIVQKMELWLNGLARYYIMFPTGKSQEFIGFPRTKKLFELYSFKKKNVFKLESQCLFVHTLSSPKPKVYSPTVPPEPPFMKSGNKEWQIVQASAGTHVDSFQREPGGHPSRKSGGESVSFNFQVQKVWGFLKRVFCPFLIKAYWCTVATFKRSEEWWPPQG